MSFFGFLPTPQSASAASSISLNTPSVDGTAVTLSWSTPKKVQKPRFEIEIRDVLKPNLRPAVYISKQYKFVSNDLKPFNAYSVRVRLTNSKQTSNWSKTLTFETYQNGPAKILIKGSTINGFSAEWTSVEKATGYEVYLDENLIKVTNLLEHQFDNLIAGRRYKIGVLAKFATRKSSTTYLEVSTETLVPSSPVISEVSTSQARISWPNYLQAKSYILKIYRPNSDSPLIEKVLSAISTSITINDLSSETQYLATLQVKYESKISEESKAAEFTTAKPVLTGLRISSVTTTNAVASWDSFQGADSYEITRDGGSSSILNATFISVGSIAPTAILSPGVTYEVRVRALYFDSEKNRKLTDWASLVFSTLTDPNARPTNTSLPIITFSGPYSAISEVIGVTAIASNGTWSSIPTVNLYTYQWQRSFDGGTTWLSIDGATSSSYLIKESDYGYRLRVGVTARNTNGVSTSNSVSTGTVKDIFNVQKPIVRGDLVLNQVLTIDPGIWYSRNQISFAYQWYRDGAIISGATSPTYQLTFSEIEKEISVVVKARSTLGSLSATSVARGEIGVIANKSLPIISGTYRATEKITASTGEWINAENDTSYSYKWEESTDGAAWSSIIDATDRNFVLTSSQIGKYVRVLVTATKFGYSDYPETAYSLPSTLIGSGGTVLNISSPSVSGSWTSGSTLSVSNGTWSSTGTYTYQWQTSTDLINWSNVSGANSNTYVITSSDASSKVYLRAIVTLTATNSGVGTAFSNSTSKVGSPYNSTLPVLSGTKKIGSPLSVSGGTWTNSVDSYTYQWQTSSDGISWIPISSSDFTTYTTNFEQKNLRFRVSVTAANTVGSTTVVSNALTDLLPPDATSLPTVSGTTEVGEILSKASDGIWPGASSGFEYIWQRSSDGTSWENVLNAITSFYKLRDIDEGYQFRLKVSLSTSAGTSTAYSLPTSPVLP